MSVVFDSFANLAKVTDEIEHLPQSARNLFEPPIGWELSSFSWERNEQWQGKWLCRWAALRADVSQDTSNGSRVVGRALLCFDLYRDRKAGVSRPKLAHAEQALMICAFLCGPNNSEEYDPDFLTFDSNGWPVYAESFLNGVMRRPRWTRRCSLSRNADFGD